MDTKYTKGTKKACAERGGAPKEASPGNIFETCRRALQTATINPAKFLGKLDSLGTVEKGKLADLVLLEANPLDDIRNTEKISAVVVNGRLVAKSELQTILANVEAAANKP